MKPAALYLALAALSLPGLAGAEQPVVVELFTSQGCSSCPPADKIMHRLAARDDVIGLALHVDYWDYIGWKDTFASPANTLRQQAYARSGGRTMIFTPQMVVQGGQDVVGTREADVMRLIEAQKAQPAQAELSVSRAEDAVSISLTPAGAGSTGDHVLQLVRYAPLRHASITRGELAGQELDYANVVESMTVVGRWNGSAALDLTVPVEGDLPVVVLVQRADAGPIVAAARIR
ncbi:DUF1223 domain-containing protein [Ruegeria marina]|uniref:Secreted protein n=1 Tax=Ruegeria marina TaxID=639004 RepID=A0A1G6QIM3_9RHOB|nr:DUF1223 domain-containing protein [Ruegeria marina]SDC92158.1 hypothetical protein SAMN04488239_104138 [Ruegeria marina]